MTPTNGNATADTAPSRTIEYHRPTRDSVHYSSGTDMALGMVPTAAAASSSSPRLPSGGAGGSAADRDRAGHAPTAYRSPLISSPIGFESPSHMQPTRAAPAPPGSKRDSGLPSSPAQYAAPSSSSSRPYTAPKSATASPNPNRYSAGPISSHHASNMTTNGAPPPRPTRAGTLPLGDLNGEPGPLSPGLPGSSRGPGGSGFAHPTPPPLNHQPFSAPTNPYAAQTLDKQMEDTNMGLGVGVPMDVQEPRDKELPQEPAMRRNRSGTGKSMGKEKKSIFGALSGESLSRSSAYPLISELLTKDNKPPVISTPYDPIHLTHVGYNYQTGQCKLHSCSSQMLISRHRYAIRVAGHPRQIWHHARRTGRTPERGSRYRSNVPK